MTKSLEDTHHGEVIRVGWGQKRRRWPGSDSCLVPPSLILGFKFKRHNIRSKDNLPRLGTVSTHKLKEMAATCSEHLLWVSHWPMHCPSHFHFTDDLAASSNSE